MDRHLEDSTPRREVKTNKQYGILSARVVIVSF